MATIAENIQTLRSIKSDIKNAIIQKGGSVTDVFGTYAQAITNLPSGSGNEDLIDLIEGDIKTLNIPEGTKLIKDYTFNRCQSLTSAIIPDTVKKIGNYAFYFCSALTDVTIGNGVTEIANYAFGSCTALKSIIIPDGNTILYDNAFNGCSALTDVTIPNSVKLIATSVFYECKSLTSVTIPSSVTKIGNYAFAHCSKLTSITIEATTPPILSSDSFSYTNISKIYVPAESVDAYKTATNWSAYADRIQAIPTV